VDSAEETAATAEELLAAEGLLSPGGTVRHRFYLSDLAPNFQTVGERFLGEPMGEVVRASVGGTPMRTDAGVRTAKSSARRARRRKR
jgi:hypothetical protein